MDYSATPRSGSKLGARGKRIQRKQTEANNTAPTITREAQLGGMLSQSSVSNV